MPRILKAEIAEIKNGISVEVEVPGYTKEDVNVELIPYTYDLFTIPISTKALYISAENEIRGKADTKLVLTDIDKVKLDDITASVKDGILTIILPYSQKFRDRIIPVT